MPNSPLVDAVGLIAAALTLAAFAQRRMLPMRLTAITANVFFIGYGSLGSYLPVLGLHLTLLPLNLLRLRDARTDVGSGPSRATAPRPDPPREPEAACVGAPATRLRSIPGADRFQLGQPLAGPAL